MVGLVLGAILGGPPGAVLGATGGAMVGELQARRQHIGDLDSELSELQAVQQREQQVAAEHQALFQRQRAKETARIEALQRGYSFCLGFRSDSATIEPGIDKQLQALAVMLRAFPELKLQISAGADMRGSEDYNNQLSKRRAEAVAAVLRASGLPEKRMEIRYIGEAQARYSMQDHEGLGYDRTVKISLFEGDAS